jgi:nucleotide-binding universal stress UspA family protein
VYKQILIATDGSELAGRAVDHGLKLAKALGAPVLIVNVTEAWASIDLGLMAQYGDAAAVSAYQTATQASAKEILETAEAVAKKAGVTCRTLHVPNHPPAEGIVATAEKEGCDLIVMASHGRRGLGRLLLGSQTVEALTYSKVPVLVVR